MPDAEHGPWIRWSHCGFGKFDPHTNELTEVACPSRNCATWVPLADGALSEHERIDGGPCPWTGVRVVDDRPDLADRALQIIDTVPARWSGKQ
ncbi:hypothetical protein [Nocardia sp. R6R-6]|uniref:hypothetical protein n=1 Tax=Nocardia sp. R6R-6 TaxID=3459303 RepID=UPI00403E1707